MIHVAGTKAIQIVCPKCEMPAGVYCRILRRLHQERIKEAAKITREANRAARARAH